MANAVRQEANERGAAETAIAETRPLSMLLSATAALSRASTSWRTRVAPLPPEAVACSASTQSAVKGERWFAVDMLRFLAVLLMVQGHTFTVVMEDAVRNQDWYRWHSYVHGFTAPMFLFASGVAFGLTTLRAWQRHITPGAVFYKRVRRYLWIIVLGYALHCPGTSFVRALSMAGTEQFRRFMMVDALQQIGVTLLLCELAVFALRRRTWFVGLAGSAGIAVVLAAPWVAGWQAEQHLPLWAAAYINRTTGSEFPIFPWTGFILMGVVTAYLAERWKAGADRTGSVSVVRIGSYLVLAGGTFALISKLADQSTLAIFPPHSYWKESPSFFLWRLGVLLMGLGGLCWLQHLLPLARRGGSPGWVKVIQITARHTLVVYVVHLLILYGSPVQKGLIVAYDHRLSLSQASAVAALMLASMIGLALGWYTLQKWRPSASRWAQAAIFAGAFYFFFLN